MRQAGINRISIGLQSADDEELKMLGRIHSYDDFLSCYDMARNVGIKNINVDIMTALPNQTEDKLMSTLSKVTAMEPEHISAYSLIIEEGTAFYEKYGGLETPVVGEDTERQLYWMCTDYLEERGYGHYEISNYARRGYNSRHNSGYWKRIPYTAFGLGASSLVNCVIDGKPVQMRTVNEDRLKEYLLDPTQKSERQVLSKDDAMDEYMFLGLRMREGVRYVDFNKEFNEDMLIRYKNSIESYTDKGLLCTDNDGIRLTRRGIDYGNYVFSGFLVNN